MTLKQWWIHFKYWLHEPTAKEWLRLFWYEMGQFPIPIGSNHMFINHVCATCECKATHIDEDIDEDLEHAMELKKILD